MILITSLQAIPERQIATPHPWSIQHVIKVTFCTVKFPSWRPGQCPGGIWVCLQTFIQTFSMPGGAAQACQLEVMLLRIGKKHGVFFRKLCMIDRSLHFSCPFGLQDWSSDKGQSQCFNWSSIPAETTLRVFCLFSLEKAYRLLCTAFLIYPAICSRRLVVNQHQLELSRRF